MTAGESSAERAAKKMATAKRYRDRAARAERDAEMFARGALGEETAATVMSALLTDGYVLLNDRCIPGSAANIDHVLIGPTGVLIIDAKNWTGELAVEGKSLRQNGRRRDKHVELIRDQAVEVADMLDELSISRAVRPVICFVGTAPVSERLLLERVHLLNAEMLVPFVRELPTLFDSKTVENVARSLDQRLPPRVTPPAPETAPTQPPTDDELVFLVSPWRKAGRDRLYVKAKGGEDMGYIDLATGDTKTTEQLTPVFQQILRHYPTANHARHDPAADSQSGGVLRSLFGGLTRKRRVAALPSLVVAHRWRNHRQDRFYFHRLDAEVKTELGWFDLSNGAIEETSPGAADVVRYWGAHFRSCEASRKESKH